MLKLVPIWDLSVFPGEDCGEDSLWFLLPTRQETMRPLNTALLHWNGPICITRANIYIIHQYTPTNQYTSYTLPPTNPRTNIHQTYLEDGEGFMWHTMCRSCHFHFFVRAFILYLMGEQQKESQILMFKLSREKKSN